MRIEAEFQKLLVQSGSESRKRSIFMPRGRRPSTAAFTSWGARNASERVRLTWRKLHCSRFANCSASVIELSSQFSVTALTGTRASRLPAPSSGAASVAAPRVYAVCERPALIGLAGGGASCRYAKRYAKSLAISTLLAGLRAEPRT